MDVAAVSHGTDAVPATVAGVSAEQVAENREVIQAVKAVNGSDLLGQENELQYARDPDTRRMVMQVVNRKTKEVVSQIPPEYVLRLAAEIKQEAG